MYSQSDLQSSNMQDYWDLVATKNIWLGHKKCVGKIHQKTIQSSLRDLGIDQKLILPVESLEGLPLSQGNISFLDLRHFDNTDFETRTPEQWLNGADDDGCRAEAFIPNDSEVHKYKWSMVLVEDYDRSTKLWKVFTLDGTSRTFNIPRIRLMFIQENLDNFAQRVRFAYDLRGDVENNIRYQLFVDCSMQHDLSSMPFEWMTKIKEFMLNEKTRKYLPNMDDNKDKIFKQVDISYKRCCNDMILRDYVANNSTLHHYVREPAAEWKRPAWQNGLFPCLMSDFQKRIDFNRWYSLSVITEASSAARLVVEECLTVEDMCFFTPNYGHMASLAEFESAQQQTISVVLKYLNLTWLENVTHSVRMSFRDIGKGWYNIQEKKWEFYEVSKLRRFMSFTQFRMQYALRSIIEKSLEMLLNMCETPCYSTLSCSEDYKWNTNDLHNSPFTSFASPLFHLTLLMDENKPYYSTPIERFHIVIDNLFEDILVKCHYIKQIHPMVMTKLVFEEEIYLTSIGLMEKNICSYRERLKYAYSKAVIPLRAFLVEFEKYKDIYNVEVPDYILSWKDAKHTVSETKAEIQRHFDDKLALINRLPQYLVIGPFHVDVDTLKQILVTKEANLVTGLLEMFAAEKKKAIEEIITGFGRMMKKLIARPHSIEHIFDIREWIDELPVTVKAEDEKTRKIIAEYDVLDHFYYPLDMEDFQLLWEAVGWPRKILLQSDETAISLVDDEDKFWTIHQQDEATMTEKIEEFIGQCINLAKHSDYSKVNDIANDIKKTWKSLKECQEWGTVLNNRKKLFGVPVTPYDDLEKVVMEFEPYRDLWIAASDFLKHREIWTCNPIVNIDTAAIETMVSEFNAIAIKSLKVFQDLPAVLKTCNLFKNDVESFQPLIPIILAVRSPILKKRHWLTFQDKTTIRINIDEKTTFQMCLDMGIANFSGCINEIYEVAFKEYEIEEILDVMVAEWSDEHLTLEKYDDSGSFIIVFSERTLQLLKEQLVTIEELKTSPLKHVFEARLLDWDERVKLMKSVIEKWLEVQEEWIFLTPIFASEEIAKTLSKEAKKFESMCRIWRKLMSNAREMTKIVYLCPDKRLMGTLMEASRLLKFARKGYSEYRLQMEETMSND